MFPGLQRRIDDAVRKVGGDPDAIRAEAAKAAVQKYQEDVQAYALLKSSCYTPAPVAPKPVPLAAAPLASAISK
jgi:hypothetical protein